MITRSFSRKILLEEVSAFFGTDGRGQWLTNFNASNLADVLASSQAGLLRKLGAIREAGVSVDRIPSQPRGHSG
jgi:hypothetical protein